MGLLQDCETHFNTKSLYQVLAVEKDATEKELKKAYRQMSLKWHPDKVDEIRKQDATIKFQTLSKVYFILGDAEKRKCYDETGCADDEIDDDVDWAAFWKNLYPTITTADIDNYMKNYKGSQEELDDIKNIYLNFKGDIDLLTEHVISYSLEEEPRIIGIIKEMIKNKEVPSYKIFAKEPAAKTKARRRKWKSEASEAEEMYKEKGLENNSLEAAIMKNATSRQSSFESMIANLEAKHSNPTPRKKRKTTAKAKK